MRPFVSGILSSTLRTMLEEVKKEIRSLDNQYVLKSSKTELEEYFIEKVLVSPLILHIDDKYIKNHEIKNDHEHGQYNEITLVIPYEGDKELWKLQPSGFIISGYPEMTIMNNEILIPIKFHTNLNDDGQLKNSINSSIDTLSRMVEIVKKDIDNHNSTAPNQIKVVIDKKIETAKSTVGMIASLGIPMKKTDQSPVYAIPSKRKPKPITLPKVQTEKYELEPFLDEREYQYILDIIHSMSLVIERNPKSFSSLDEQSIRDHFLLQLNGHYEGGATGETFNASGKTDILIREGDKNVFIAECKFWDGPKVFNDAIAQLLGYLTWRDLKTALLIFNRNKDLSKVLVKMNETIENHPEYKKTEYFKNSKGFSGYIFVKNSEPGKEIIITTQLYDIPITD